MARQAQLVGSGMPEEGEGEGTLSLGGGGGRSS